MVFVGAIASPGHKLLFGEGDSAENLTRILGRGSGGVAAFFRWDTVIQYRHHQLCISLQSDQGELSQGDKQPAAVIVQHQLFVKIRPDAGWDLHSQVLTGTVADLPDLGAENHGVQDLYHGGGTIGTGAAWAVWTLQPGVGGEDVSPAILAAEYRPLGEAG